MAKIQYPEKVPCVACGTMVAKKLVAMTIKQKQCEILIEDVPQYECACGCLFIPSEVQARIQELENAKNMPKGKLVVSYSELMRKGVRGIKKF